MSDTVLIQPPGIPDAMLVFNEEETRQILRFFWPHLNAEIGALEITNPKRRFAQQILIAAIDATFALGFMERLLNTVLRPQAGFKGLASMGRKLAKSYVKHWWKHASQDDLKNPRVAEAVRRDIARNFKSEVEMLIRDASISPRLAPFYACAMATTLWGDA
jgi:hypothetical protein